MNYYEKRVLILLGFLGGCLLVTAQTEKYKMPESGFLLFEAENLPYSDSWELVKPGHNNVLGTGYLKYIGPVTGSGPGQEVDSEGKLQGNRKDWLVIPIEISEPGRYRIDLRNHHMRKDGDNDIWVHVIDYPLPIRRVGDHAIDSFQWLTWGTEWTYFDLEEPGTYQFYIAGRSQGFGIDRIAIFNETAKVSMYYRKSKTAN